MPIKLFALNGVPEDEADEVRVLLTAEAIDFYETPAGNWGISAPAIWLKQEREFQKARALLDAYQEERRTRIREEYARLRRQGRQRTMLDVIRENPLRFLVYLAAIFAVVYFSTQPFMDIGE